MEGQTCGMLIANDDGDEGTQVNFSQRMQGGPDLSLLPNHNYSLGRNSQDFVCRSQERGKVTHLFQIQPTSLLWLHGA